MPATKAKKIWENDVGGLREFPDRAVMPSTTQVRS